MFGFQRLDLTLTLPLDLSRPSSSFSTTVGQEEAQDDYQVPSSTVCLRQAPVCISVPQRYSRCILVSKLRGCQNLESLRTSWLDFILLFRYVENSSSAPSDEEKQPQVLELGESASDWWVCSLGCRTGSICQPVQKGLLLQMYGQKHQAEA